MISSEPRVPFSGGSLTWQAKIRLLAVFGSGLLCSAQTVQGIIAGQVTDSVSGAPVVNARITISNQSINLTQSAPTNSSGNYTATSLPPGTYHVRVSAARYQPQEAYSLELPVSGVIDLNFLLRPLVDVWESGRYRSVLLPNSESVLTFFGPDVDASLSEIPLNSAGATGALEASVSQVVDPVVLNNLPLPGRDVYTLLVTQPAVTADTTTSRGLGLAINGQRPTASDFLLDGFENNNYLLTGPQTMVAPEAVQEYRISTSTFSAEYGRTAGYLANALTRAGSNQWHGLAYMYVQNDALNANDFQNNATGLSRPPLKEYQPGYQTGGYLLKNSLFFSSAFGALISHGSGDKEDVILPTTDFTSNFTNPGSIARTLLQEYPIGVRQSNTNITVSAMIQPPVTIDHYLALERLDHVAGDGAHRQMLRVAYAKLDRPDFIWSPYKEFISGLSEPSLNLALSATDVLSPSVSLETKAGISTDNLSWNRAHPEIPTLFSLDGTLLPGSPAFYAFRNRSANIEFLENVSWVLGRHLFKAGGGLLFRRVSGYLTAGAGGEYTFDNVRRFGVDTPESLTVSLTRQALPQLSLPDFDRTYRYDQFDFFVQDTFRVTRRLAVNYGIRYENFGAPVNTGPEKDATVILGDGNDFAARLASASVTLPGPGNQQLYKPDNKNWAGRIGFSYGLLSSENTVLHGAYGIFYDRPFDNLWQTVANNNFILPSFDLGLGPVNYLAPLSQVLPSFARQQVSSTNFPYLTMFRPDLKSPYVQSYFLGLQQRLTTNLTFDLNGLGALGRRLITTDEVNRPYGVYNSNLPIIDYRANQGSSDYYALTAVLTGRFTRCQVQVAYTWSHSIDNQSDPLTGDFFDLRFAGSNSARPAALVAAFTRQFDSSGDRGNSDFDQRHNFVFYSTWNLPAPSGPRWIAILFQDWRFAQLAAFRTGEPYTVMAPGSSLEFVENRVNLLNEPVTTDAQVNGGKLLLNAAAFQAPAPGQVGNLGRNSLYGPGLYSADVSLSRSIRVATLGESGRLVLRADAFNVLNHANLNNPNPVLGPGFGVAQYGRKGFDTGFPSLTPLNESGRQIQLMLRVEF